MYHKPPNKGLSINVLRPSFFTKNSYSFKLFRIYCNIKQKEYTMNNKFKTTAVIGRLTSSIFMCIYAYKEWKKYYTLNKACT